MKLRTTKALKWTRFEESFSRRLAFFGILAGCFFSETAAEAIDGHMPSEGLTQSDWTSIQTAHDAWLHGFMLLENGGWQARNPGQRWTASFDGKGFLTKPREASWQWGLEFQSYGFGARQIAASSTSPEVKSEGQRLSYQWGDGFTEWFVNDSHGLEHGFTLQHRPTVAPESGELDVVLAVRGGLRPVLSSDGETVVFQDGSGTAIVHYAGLKVWDARQKILPSRFVVTPEGRLILRVAEASATYPLTIDPIARQAYLKADAAGSANAGDLFGSAVAISGDTVVIGAPGEDSSTTGVNSNPDEAASGAGAAYVFVRNGAAWTQQAYLKPSVFNPAGQDGFGTSVAISGNTLIIGAPGEDSGSTGVNSTPVYNRAGSGATYVFVRSGAAWSQQAYLKTLWADTGEDRLGTSVSISGDTVVVGAPGEDSSTTGVGSTPNNSAGESGAAYVFTRSGTSWSQSPSGYLKASNTAGYQRFGTSVSIDGDSIIVGAYGESSNTTGVDSTPNLLGFNHGAAYVFARNEGFWGQQAYLKADPTSSHGDAYFGSAVAIQGNTAVVGIPWRNVTSIANRSGGACVFVRNGTTWSHQALLRPLDSELKFGIQVGGSVGISRDTVVLGSLDDNAEGSGAVLVFVRKNSAWARQTTLKGPQLTSGDQFGAAVAISGDTVVVGAPKEDSATLGIDTTPDEGSTDSGAASIFTGLGPDPTLADPTVSGITATSAVLGGTVVTDGGGAILEHGIVYAPTGTNADPLISGTGVVKVMGTGTTGVFTVGVNGLVPGMIYTFKAYATNDRGTSYTTVGTFTTLRPPVIRNLTATQRPGTKLVDLSYDLSAPGFAGVVVRLQVSSDGGASWSVPVNTVTGANVSVAPGTGCTIVWDAGTDWPLGFSTQMRYRLIADDGVTPLAGFSYIPAGAFTMGRTSSDTDSNAPPTSVTVSSFYTQQTETTKVQWEEVRTWAAANGYDDLPAGGGKAVNHPVQNISWWDAVKWCNARSEKEGLTPCYTMSGGVMRTGTSDPDVNWNANGYRLPTEAEWEKAARGALAGLRYPWGTDTINHTRANYNSSGTAFGNQSDGAGVHPSYTSGGTPYTNTVGVFAANPFGLYDIAGNVSEWCWDWYAAGSYVAGATDPRGPATGTSRVTRGGSWNDGAGNARCASRAAGSAGATTGFRPVRGRLFNSFVEVPGGTFTMGRILGETDIDAPPVSVTVSAYHLQETETTKAQWDNVRAWAINHGYSLGDASGKGANHPAVDVGWWNAALWCNARSEMEGLTPCYRIGGTVMRTAGASSPDCDWPANGYRLPTEAEWEKAARGGVNGKSFPSGEDSISHDDANFSQHPTYGTIGSEPFTAPVASFAPNPYGFHDMAGNVHEWCWDWYDSSSYVNGTSDPRGPIAGINRVLRGGSWGSGTYALRCSFRNSFSPDWQNSSIGFRLVRGSIGGNTGSIQTANATLDLRDQPTVTTATSSGITATAAVLGGNVTSDGGGAITERGVIYAPTATNADPIIGGTGVVKVVGTGTTGVFTVNVTGLLPETAYSFEAYAINARGTTYTSTGTFTTLSNNADLTALTLSSGSLSPAFASGTTAYTASVSNTNTTITITPTAARASSSIDVRINGGAYASVSSGTASAALVLPVGTGNTVDVRVTAQDGTLKTYTITITRPAIDPTFSTAGTIPVAANGYTATGDALGTVTLGFAPTTGLILTVVNNTSSTAITGTLPGLAQGQAITLTHNSVPYTFYVDYFGGTGNDLVLVLAGPGAVDYTFGTSGTGRVLTGADGNNAVAAMVQQPDGRILYAGFASAAQTNSVVGRLLTNGAIDTSFNTSGVRTVDMSPSGADSVAAFALQSDGRIIAVGYATPSAGLQDFGVFRLTVDGALDTSFNTNGTRLIDLGGTQEGAAAVEVLPDGKILIAGDTNASGGKDLTVIRLNPNGTLDTTFGTGGSVLLDLGAADDSFTSLAVQTDGKILLGGMSAGQFFVSRLQPNGATDASFGTAGMALTTFDKPINSLSVLLQADQKIVLAGTVQNGSTIREIALARLLADGALDTAYGTAGKSRFALAPPFTLDVARSVLQPDGKILMAGNFMPSANDFRYGAVRFTSSGMLDTSFNGIGYSLSKFRFGGATDTPTAILCLRDGRYLLAGHALSPAVGGDYEFGFLSLQGDPALSGTFTTAGDIPLTASDFEPAGRTLNLTLGFAPPVGTRLTVLRNTGLNPIVGEFANLAHGQPLSLAFEGLNYDFVANYFGGDGNDLTLEWAYTKLAAFGSNESGQLGITGTAAQANRPTQVVASSPIYQKTILSVSAGLAHSLAVCADGTVAAWGSNVNGQLGNGGTTSALRPAAVTMTGVLSGKKVVAVAAGGQHSLALCSDGTLVAWGDGSYGQLGDGGVLDRTSPVRVNWTGAMASKRAIAISAGENHSAALCSDGTVVCWGRNTNGELGNASNTQSNIPVAVSLTGALAARTVVALSCGQSHTLALLADGAVAAWGLNANGQLGNGSTTASNVPVLVSTAGALSGKRVVEIAAGGHSSIVGNSDGTLVAWGLNDNGQLGVNSTTSSFSAPQAVFQSGALTGKTANSIQMGASSASVVCSDGSMAAWGAGAMGQLGHNATTGSSVPVTVNNAILEGTDAFIAAAGGAQSFHELALIAAASNTPMIEVTENGVVVADNANAGTSFGSLLNGGTRGKTFLVRNTGMQILSGLAATMTGTGVEHYSIASQPVISLAPGEMTQIRVEFSPFEEGTKQVVLRIANNLPGQANPFDTRLTGTSNMSLLATWLTGREIPVQAIDFDATDKQITFNLGYAPTAGSTLTVLRNQGTKFIDGLFKRTVFDDLNHGDVIQLTHNGTVYPFIVNYYGGDGNDLVLEWVNTRLLAWGAGVVGQLGTGSNADSGIPLAINMNGVLSGKTILSVACGFRHTVVLCSDGTLAAWGNNSVGQLGNGGSSTAHSNVPVLVYMDGAFFGKTPVAVAAGEDFSAVLCSDGTVVSWGVNTNGQLGNNSTSLSRVPVLVNVNGALLGQTITAVAAGGRHVLARGSDGALYSWGLNTNGQLGNGNNTRSLIPVLINGGALTGKKVLQIAAGNNHSLCTCTDGTMAGWGSNGFGTLGNGTPTSSNLPVFTDTSGAMDGRSPVQQFGGESHSVLLAQDGNLVAWGNNDSGQIGMTLNLGDSYLLPTVVPQTGALAGRTPIFLASGSSHNVALMDDGTLASWGLNDFGQLGVSGQTVPIFSTTPLAVNTSNLQAGEKVRRVYAGAFARHNVLIAARPLTIPGGPPLVSTNAATAIDKTSVTLNALISPNNLSTDARFEYGTTTSFGTQTALQNLGNGSTSVAMTQNLTGLLPNTTYYFRIVAGNSGGSVQGDALTFTTMADPPVAVTSIANSISNSGSTLAGTVNPNNRMTSVYFQFGTTTLYGNTTAPQSVLAGTSGVGVIAPISGLTLGTTYHYRLVAENAGGVAYGDNLTFTTTSVFAPSIGSVSDSSRTTSSVTLQGLVNPNGLNTSAYFEYGLTNSYGGITPNLAAGNGVTPGSVSSSIIGLQPGTTYQYRLVAFNDQGITRGANAAFTTLPLPPIVFTQAATPLSTTSARLHGTVNAKYGSAVVTFEWGTDGVNFPNSLTATPSPVTGDTVTAVSVDLSNLEQFTTYHYRVRAVSNGGETLGSVLTFQPQVISGLLQQFPGVPSTSDGTLTVTLAPTGILSGWRFVGERRWRSSGDTVTGLVHGSRDIEFRPVPGYLQPGLETVVINTSGQVVDYEYFTTPSPGSGGIVVVLKPDALAMALNEADRGQWRLLGETTWRDSGSTAPALPAGTYLVECKSVSGYSTPAVASINVSGGQTTNPTLVYFTASSPTGLAPVVQAFGTVSTDTTKPYAYVGQIRSNAGAGTGFIVKPRVVATAAHVVWDDGTLSAAQGVQWLFQRDAGTHDPVPLTPQGFYTFDGYAAQRIADNSPGQSSPQSQHLDVAALYFNTNAGREGFSGWLGSDLNNNEFLLSGADKMLVGYPIDTIAPEFQGRMHTTAAAKITFTGAFGRTFTTNGLHSFGGNSGGPLCVQNTSGSWYPAAIYLGGTNQTVVRAIDSEVINLFNRAETSSTGGGNNTGGGITHTGYTITGSARTGAVIINITPGGMGWRPAGSTKAFTPGSNTRSALPAGTLFVEFTPVAGYQTPVGEAVQVVAGTTQTYSITYQSSQTPQETWRQSYFGTTANSGDAADDNDYDHDGFTNTEEFAAGTNPKLSGDFFKAENPHRSGGTFTLSTAGRARRAYALQRSTTMAAGSWTTVDTEGPLGSDGPVSLTDVASPNDAAFYRIQVTGP